MKKLTSVFILCLFHIWTLNAQSISDIVVSSDRGKIAFVKDGDSLFVKNLATNDNANFVDNGLRDNGNQRFLNWTNDSKNVIYEKNENIWVYSLKERTTKQVQHHYLDSLSLFKWYLIRQTSVNDKGEVFFSAALKKRSDPTFQLFRLNLMNGEVRQLTNSSSTVSNVSVSKNNRRVAFASYEYIDDVPYTKITVINPTSGKVLAETEMYGGSFFAELKWSNDGRRILAIDNENKSKLLAFEAGKGLTLEKTLDFEKSEKVIGFFDDCCLLFSAGDNGKKSIGIYDLRKGIKKVLIEEASDFVALAGNPKKSQLLFLKESPTQPKVILNAKSSRAGGVSISEVYSFSRNNPLNEFGHITFRYRNTDGDSMSSQVYFPEGYGQVDRKKYPLLVIPYGGYDNSYPNLGYFLNDIVFDYLSQGYVLAFPNTRGIDYERQSDNYGKLQLEDTEKFINELSRSHSIDSSRIFAVGHSHGATMVYYYLTHSTLFTGGIAVNGASDWIRQAERKSMSGLPFGMGGMPDELESKYKEFSPLENVDELTSPMLIIAGKEDSQIPFDINAVSFYNRANELGKHVKLVVFDDEGHLIDRAINRTAMRQEFKLFLENKK